MNPKLFSQMKKTNAVVKKTGTNTMSVDRVFLGATAKVGIFRETFNTEQNTLLHTLYISNDDYAKLIKRNVKKERYINERGEIRVYKQVQDGIYLHNNKSILAPLLLNLIVKQNDIMPDTTDKDWKQQIINENSYNHTGNHYRNRIVRVPKKSIGQ